VKHRLFNLAAAVSLSFCALALVLWVRSYYVRDIIDFGRKGGGSHTAQSILGRVHVVSSLGTGRESGRTIHASDRLSPHAIWNGGMSGYPPRVEWHFGCVWQRYSKHLMSVLGVFATERRLVVVPYRWLVALSAVLPAIAVIRAVRRRHRAVRALCVKCGYDLRATPDRCPECGTAPKNAM
jgi:hypothetical protein